jgi:DNA polymerase-3 subunit gamma/tau
VPAKAVPAITAKARRAKTSESEAAPAEPAPRRQTEKTERSAEEPKPAAASQPDAKPASGAIDAAALRRLWPDVLEVVKQSSRRTRALLDNAQVSSVDGNRLTVSAATAPLAKMIREDGNIELLRTALASIVGGAWEVDVAMSGGNARAVPTEPDPRDQSGDGSDYPTDAADTPEAQLADPEAEALSLLRSTLGVRPIDE